MAILKTLTAPPSLPVLRLEPFTPAAFAPFGVCIETPRASTSPTNTSFPPAINANQGTALKYPHISSIVHTYPPPTPSTPEATHNLHLFSCSPRALPPSGEFAVRILERHPCTTQTFIPLAFSDAASSDTPEAEAAAYVVIVAPTAADGWPVLEGVRAFRAERGQAVTYSAGTWHAPMVVLGGRVDFVVVVAENGTAVDCEEVLIEGEGGEGKGKEDGGRNGEGGGVRVLLREEKEGGNWGLWEKGRGKARL
ncbi:putative ureidoglycolate hydrolase [Tricharina praecox]|uniref:putative ureidoglycolate hydrolase n=1 Tax=Tricharina praecox TaxID=43433 RepID=UPI00221FF7C6|nr:putative ureidoglycolate hydrolase [Tricharina praecox]KAI5856981.1 putative ureidoglycolate hydrolase [Tricharina praecox]